MRRRAVSLVAVFPMALAVAACCGGVRAAPDEAASTAPPSASGVTGYGIDTRVIVDSQSVAEGDAGETIMVVDVRLSPKSYSVIYVDYSTADGSARDGVDYRGVQGRLQFDPGELQKTIEIPVIGDAVDEPDEQFLLLLQQRSKARVHEPVKVALHIVDDD